MKLILFCDFYGVLSHDKFWRSLSSDEYQRAQNFLFGKDSRLINNWMLGKYIAEEINQRVADHTGISFEKLWEIFVKDCQSIRVSKKILDKLNNLRDRYAVILITANMDSFMRFTVPALKLTNYFDRISSSSEEGMDKDLQEGILFLQYANE